METSQTPAEVLGVSPYADEAEIRLVFLQHVKSIHPDLFDDPYLKSQNYHKLLKIQNAYDLLMMSNFCDLDYGESERHGRNLRLFAKSSGVNGNLDCLRDLVMRLNDELMYVLGCDNQRAGNLEDALKCFSRLVRQRQYNWVLHQRIAEVYLEMGSLNLAHSSIARAKELGGDIAKIHYIMGRIEERAGNRRKARKHYVKAHKGNPIDPRIREAYNRGSLVAEAWSRRLKSAITPKREAEAFDSAEAGAV